MLFQLPAELCLGMSSPRLCDIVVVFSRTSIYAWRLPGSQGLGNNYHDAT